MSLAGVVNVSMASPECYLESKGLGWNAVAPTGTFLAVPCDHDHSRSLYQICVGSGLMRTTPLLGADVVSFYIIFLHPFSWTRGNRGIRLSAFCYSIICSY